MKRYKISKNLLKETIENPDSIVESFWNRRIYQKKLDGHIVRVIIEEAEGIKRVVTTYKARSGRYGI